jgi:hypothetical protein
VSIRVLMYIEVQPFTGFVWYLTSNRIKLPEPETLAWILRITSRDGLVRVPLNWIASGISISSLPCHRDSRHEADPVPHTPQYIGYSYLQ